MKVYFVGIGGSSMSALAVLLHAKGHSVRGSDRTGSRVTRALAERGIPVSVGHGESLADSDLVVYTCGVSPDNPQLVQARALGLPMLERAELLGLLSREYEPVIAVAGTHGKTTTAALLGRMLARFSPTVHIGGEGSAVGGRMLVTEACEYNNSFLTLAPDVAILLNVESDHPDFYRSDAQLQASFGAFCRGVRADGLLVATDRGPCLRAAESSRARTVVVGRDTAADDVRFEGAHPTFVMTAYGRRLGRVRCGLSGAQVVEDVLAAATVALAYGADFDTIADAAETFGGVPRRWETVGTACGATVIADYAHHPTQIAACIATARRLARRVCVLFQPHTYSRTRALFSEFARALAGADAVCLIDVYAARETSDPAVDSEKLARAVGFFGGKAIYCASKDEAADAFRKLLDPSAVALVLGAGDVYDLCPRIADGAQTRTSR